MAMTPNGMASEIIGSINGSTDAYDANSKFYKALCNYVENNAQVFYGWVGTNPVGIPDPQTQIIAKIKTSGSLLPSGATTCESALAQFSADLNRNASSWQIIWPSGFALSPAFVIPTIHITPSKATEQNSAMIHVCSEIIAGIKQATMSAAGTHTSFVGNATFTQIL